MKLNYLGPSINYITTETDYNMASQNNYLDNKMTIDYFTPSSSKEDVNNFKNSSQTLLAMENSLNNFLHNLKKSSPKPYPKKSYFNLNYGPANTLRANNNITSFRNTDLSVSSSSFYDNKTFLPYYKNSFQNKIKNYENIFNSKIGYKNEMANYNLMTNNANSKYKNFNLDNTYTIDHHNNKSTEFIKINSDIQKEIYNNNSRSIKRNIIFDKKLYMNPININNNDPILIQNNEISISSKNLKGNQENSISNDNFHTPNVTKKENKIQNIQSNNITYSKENESKIFNNENLVVVKGNEILTIYPNNKEIQKEENKNILIQENKLSEVNDENMKAQLKNELDNQILQLKNQNEEKLNQIIKEKNCAVQDLVDENIKIKEEFEKLKSQVKNNDDKNINSIPDNSDEKKKYILEIVKENKDIKSQLTILKSLKNTAVAENKKFKEMSTNLKKENEELKKKKDEYKKQNDILNNELVILKKLQNNQKNKTKKICNDNKSVNSEKGKRQLNVESQKENFTILNTNNKIMNDDDILNNLKSENFLLKEETKKLTEKNLENENKIKELEDKIKNLSTDLTKYVSEVKTYKKQIEELKNKNNKNLNKSKIDEKENDRVKKLFTTKSLSSFEKTKKNNNINSSQYFDFIDLKKQNKKYEIENALLKQRIELIDNKNQSISNSQKAVEDMKKNNATLINNNKEIKSKNEQLRSIVNIVCQLMKIKPEEMKSSDLYFNLKVMIEDFERKEKNRNLGNKSKNKK